MTIKILNENFVDHLDGTVTEIYTGRRWKRCSEGQQWNSETNSCDGEATKFFPGEAERLYRGKYGSSSWRLPTVNELSSLYWQSGTESGSIDTNVFPSGVDARYLACKGKYYYNGCTDDYNDVDSGSYHGLESDFSPPTTKYDVLLVRSSDGEINEPEEQSTRWFMWFLILCILYLIFRDATFTNIKF